MAGFHAAEFAAAAQAAHRRPSTPAPAAGSTSRDTATFYFHASPNRTAPLMITSDSIVDEPRHPGLFTPTEAVPPAGLLDR